MSEYSGRTVFVTGAGSGMGLLSARRLAAAGAHVVGFTRGATDDAQAAVESDRASQAQRVRFYSADVADRSATRAAINLAVADSGAPDLLVHMAGIGGVAEMVDMPFEMFDRMLQVNLYGTRHVVEALLPHLLNRKEGRRPKLVLAGSMGGFVPVFGYTAYGTSKFAVVGFAKCLRYELKPRGIDVCCFCPGEVATPALRAERQHSHPATLALKKIGGTIEMDSAIDGLLTGIRRNRFLIVPGWRTRLVHWAVRLTPESVWNAATDAIVAQALRTASR
jgi:3-dehydrosphinganine reductase